MLDENHGDKLFIKLQGEHSGKIARHANGILQFVMPLTQGIKGRFQASYF